MSPAGEMSFSSCFLNGELTPGTSGGEYAVRLETVTLREFSLLIVMILHYSVGGKVFILNIIYSIT